MTVQFDHKRNVHGALDGILHPHWSSRDDHLLVTAKRSGGNFTNIAATLGRPRVAVEQRWHRLRVVPEIEKKLETYGLSIKPYPYEGGTDG